MANPKGFIPTAEQRGWAELVVDEFNKYSGKPVPRTGVHTAVLADFVARRDIMIKASERARCAKVCSDRAASEGSDSTDTPRAVEAEACSADILALS
jgi:hypothetical protein